MIHILTDSINNIVVSVKGRTKSVDDTYILSVVNNTNKTTQSVSLTDTANVDSTWLKMALNEPINISLVDGEYSYELKRNDNNEIVSNGLMAVRSIKPATKQYTNGKQYKQYNKG
jgi:hypothetical protein